MSVYGLMAKLSSSGLGMKDFGLTITVFCSVSLLFFICDEGHIASYNVKKLFQKKILMVELSWMNSDATVEINMFLRATEMNQTHINLGGFFNVDRNLFKSVRSQLIVK
jgi:gustatory receptor